MEYDREGIKLFFKPGTLKKKKIRQNKIKIKRYKEEERIKKKKASKP